MKRKRDVFEGLRSIKALRDPKNLQEWGPVWAFRSRLRRLFSALHHDDALDEFSFEHWLGRLPIIVAEWDHLSRPESVARQRAVNGDI